MGSETEVAVLEKKKESSRIRFKPAIERTFMFVFFSYYVLTIVVYDSIRTLYVIKLVQHASTNQSNTHCWQPINGEIKSNRVPTSVCFPALDTGCSFRFFSLLNAL